FLLAAFIYIEAIAVIFRLRQTRIGTVSRDVWLPWIDQPSRGVGHLGDVVRFIFATPLSDDTLTRLEAVRTRVVPEINNKITLLSVLVTLAPLLGLLGTV